MLKPAKVRLRLRQFGFFFITKSLLGPATSCREAETCTNVRKKLKEFFIILKTFYKSLRVHAGTYMYLQKFAGSRHHNEVPTL